MKSINCDACGSEELETDLTTQAMSGFKRPMRLCKKCSSMNGLESLKDAASILKDIVKTAKSKEGPEERLNVIRSLLGMDKIL